MGLLYCGLYRGKKFFHIIFHRLKLDNVVHKIKDKVAEIKVHIPRCEFFVKQSSKSFEESFDTALDSVITQIKRKKDKQAA